jgi:uncharacterized protein (TIGR02145 family)
MKKLLFILTMFLSFVSFGQDKFGIGNDPEGCDSAGVGANTLWVKIQTQQYILTVTDGTGSGNYAENAVVEISADAPPTGYVWDHWSGDTQYIDDLNASTTNVTIPAGAVNVTANYQINGGEVTIGTQVWMLRNLDIDDGLGGIYAPNGNFGNVADYGYLYIIEAAIRVAATIPGWHLPTAAEWQTFGIYIYSIAPCPHDEYEAKIVREIGDTHWQPGNTATNASGFTALGAGYYIIGYSYEGFKKNAFFWGGVYYSPNYSGCRIYYYDDFDTFVIGSWPGVCAFSVRLIKD